MQVKRQWLLIHAKEDGCYALFLLELSTGLRRGEILALQSDNLNFKTGALRVEQQVHRRKGALIVLQPKTNSSNRTVILPCLGYSERIQAKRDLPPDVPIPCHGGFSSGPSLGP